MLGDGVLRQAEADGRVALRVDVDEQRLVAGLGDAGGEVDGGGGLADARPSGWRSRRRCPCAASRRTHGSDEHGQRGRRESRAERALARHPRAAGEARRRGRHLAQDVQVRCSATGIRMHDERISATARPSSSAAAGGSRSSSPSRRPFHATSTPPSRSSGAAYSARTASGASARAVTTIVARRGPRPRLGARVRRPPRSSSPGGVDSRLEERALAHRRSRPARRAPSSASASGRPGKPAPEPRSAIAGRADLRDSSPAASRRGGCRAPGRGRAPPSGRGDRSSTSVSRRSSRANGLGLEAEAGHGCSSVTPPPSRAALGVSRETPVGSMH